MDKALKFSIDRASRIKLPYQVADALRSAIQCGEWKPGERLPSSRELKAALGTSIRAPAEALQILAREGLITLREKCGAVVNAYSKPQIRGRVLLIVQGGAQVRSISCLMEWLRRKLNAAGYMVVTTSVLRDEGSMIVDGDTNPYNLQQLEFDLKTSFSLAVLNGEPDCTEGIVGKLSDAKVPFLVIYGQKSAAANCIGGIPVDEQTALAELVSHARRTEISRAVLVRKWRHDGDDYLAAMRSAGIKVETLTVPQKNRRGRAEDLWQESFALFERRFAKSGKSWLPDLVCFTDDHCFQGAAVSILHRGVKVPEDVCLVTATNAGMRPPFPVSLACVENDLKSQAEVVAKAALDYLEHGRHVPPGLTLGTSYVPGATFL